jgi:hypothetical protein
MARGRGTEAPWDALLRRPRRPHPQPHPQSWTHTRRPAARPRRSRSGSAGRVLDPGVQAQRVMVKTAVVRLGSTGHRSLKGWLHDHRDDLERDGTSPTTRESHDLHPARPSPQVDFAFCRRQCHHVPELVASGCDMNRVRDGGALSSSGRVTSHCLAARRFPEGESG